MCASWYCGLACPHTCVCVCARLLGSARLLLFLCNFFFNFTIYTSFLVHAVDERVRYGNFGSRCCLYIVSTLLTYFFFLCVRKLFGGRSEHTIFRLDLSSFLFFSFALLCFILFCCIFHCISVLKRPPPYIISKLYFHYYYFFSHLDCFERYCIYALAFTHTGK